MPEVTFVLPDGSARTVEATPGRSVMRAALDHDVPGIVAECGGNAMCATCHVYVAPETAPVLPQVEEEEDEMLESTASPREASSRLSCQVTVAEDWGRATFRIPKTQL